MINNRRATIDRSPYPENGSFLIHGNITNAALPMVILEISHWTNVTSKYGDLALQVGGVSDDTVK
jgi:hypothetical protein